MEFRPLGTKIFLNPQRRKSNFQRKSRMSLVFVPYRSRTDVEFAKVRNKDMPCQLIDGEYKFHMPLQTQTLRSQPDQGTIDTASTEPYTASTVDMA